MLPGMEMLACPNLAVSPEVMQHIVHVESSANPYAIGVVGGQLEHQPGSLPEALATVRMLDAKGYNFSLGLAQVNRANFDRYGLDSYTKAFDACANLSAGARILADCHTRAHGDWPKAFSCYYSGNFTTGFRDGYVQKIYASIDHQAGKPVNPADASPAPIGTTARRAPPAATPMNVVTSRHVDLKPVTVYAPRGANYRVTLRSMAIDATAAATVPATAAMADAPSPTRTPTSDGGRTALLASRQSNVPGKPTFPQRQGAADGSSPDDAVFVPEVRGPDDLPGISAPARTRITAQTGRSKPGVDPANPRQEQRDAAFVF
jgi:type IV secretion system protein VirB1